MSSVSAFSRCSRVGKRAWEHYVDCQPAYVKPFFTNLSVLNLYDNPALVSRNRLTNACSTLSHTYHEINVFLTQPKDTFVDFVTKIYLKEKDLGLIKNGKGTTSTSEELVRLMLVLGTQGTYDKCRNNLKESAVSVVYRFEG